MLFVEKKKSNFELYFAETEEGRERRYLSIKLTKVAAAWTWRIEASTTEIVNGVGVGVGVGVRGVFR